MSGKLDSRKHPSLSTLGTSGTLFQSEILRGQEAAQAAQEEREQQEQEAAQAIQEEQAQQEEQTAQTEPAA